MNYEEGRAIVMMVDQLLQNAVDKYKVLVDKKKWQAPMEE
jgi:hypothetical protein